MFCIPSKHIDISTVNFPQLSHHGSHQNQLRMCLNKPSLSCKRRKEYQSLELQMTNSGDLANLYESQLLEGLHSFKVLILFPKPLKFYQILGCTFFLSYHITILNVTISAMPYHTQLKLMKHEHALFCIEEELYENAIVLVDYNM